MLLLALFSSGGCDSRQRLAQTPPANVANAISEDHNGTRAAKTPERSPLSTPGAATPPEASPMLTGKPYLSIQVDAFHVPFEIFVNSGYITTDGTGATASEKWPINPFLRSGTNEIGVLMYGWADGAPGAFEDDAKLTLRVLVKQADSEASQEHELFVIAFNGNATASAVATEGSTVEGSLDSARSFARVDQGDVELGPVKIRRIPQENVTVLTRSLNLRLPFPEWAFLRSDQQTPTIELNESEVDLQHDQLLTAYEEVWSLLASRNLDKLMPLFEERSREIDLALYQESGTTQAKLREAFESALTDSTCALAPVRPKKGGWYYNVAPGGRLARLTNSDHGGAIIRFKYGSSDFARVFPIMFRKQGSRFIVAR